MNHEVKIDGNPVVIAWNEGTRRRMQFRAAKHGVKLDTKALFDPNRAAAAYVEILWLMLPPETFVIYGTPEDLAAGINHRTESPAIVSAVLAALTEMVADEQKKTSSESTPSPASNLASPRKNGTATTRNNAKPLSTHGKPRKSAKK